MQAKYPVKVRAIRSKGQTDRIYVFIPLLLAAAIGPDGGEESQWRHTLQVKRFGLSVDETTQKKKKRRVKKKLPTPVNTGFL